MIPHAILAGLLLVGPASWPVAVEGTLSPPQDTVSSPLTLAEVLASAVRTHPVVMGAEAQRDAAAAATAEARAARLPTVAATALATQHQEPMVVAPIHGFTPGSLPDFEETLYQGHASAEYTLFDGGARGARIRASEAVAASAASGVTAARERVLAEATSAYLAALTALDVRQAHDRWVRALEEERERASLLFEEGKTARLAVLRTEAALSRARAEREAAEEDLRLALRRLSRASGVDPTRVLNATLVAVEELDEELPDRTSLVEQARSGNPALAQAGSRVSAAETGVAAARSSWLPRVAVSGRYSAFAAPGVDLQAEWQAGVQVSYPLFTGGARGAGVARAEAEAEAARSRRALAEQEVADAVDAALGAYRSATARVTALEAAVEQSAEVARIEALALESGAGVQTDYLRAEAQLVEARSGLAQARHAKVLARVRLAQATGTLTMEWLAQMTEKGRAMRRRIAVVVVLVVVAVVAWFTLRGGSDAGEIDASGTVEATDADLGFSAPGRVAEVAVREGDRVRQGDVLARLEASEMEARRAAAEAQLEAARAALAEMEAGARSEEIAQARAGVRATEQQMADARRDVERARTLYEGGAISREALDKAETRLEVTGAQLEQARQGLQAVEAGPRRERIRAQRAAVSAAEAAVRQVAAALDNTVVTAPFAGRVTTRHRDPGETVQPGQPVLTLLNPDDRWVRIYVAEDRIGAVAIGEPAIITSDTYPDREYEGRVVFIAEEAEFTPRNVQTREDRVKLVYAVRVEITGDPDYVLKPGTPADVRLVSAVGSAAERDG